MSIKFNDEDKYLLSRWDDVFNLGEALKKLNSRYQKMLEERIKECDWWREDELNILFESDRKKEFSAVNIFKKSWKWGNNKWDLITFGLNNIDFDSIIGHGDDVPLAFIYTENVKKLGVDVGKFNDTLLKEVNDSFPSKFEKWKEQSIYYNFPQPKELVDAMKKGELIDILIEHLNILGECIEPIDRTMEKYCSRTK